MWNSCIRFLSIVAHARCQDGPDLLNATASLYLDGDKHTFELQTKGLIDPRAPTCDTYREAIFPAEVVFEVGTQVVIIIGFLMVWQVAVWLTEPCEPPRIELGPLLCSPPPHTLTHSHTR